MKVDLTFVLPPIFCVSTLANFAALPQKIRGKAACINTKKGGNWILDYVDKVTGYIILKGIIYRIYSKAVGWISAS